LPSIHPSSGVEVAIRILKPEVGQELVRLAEEFSITHPNGEFSQE
jgi:hypothetical protein